MWKSEIRFWWPDRSTASFVTLARQTLLQVRLQILSRFSELCTRGVVCPSAVLRNFALILQKCLSDRAAVTGSVSLQVTGSVSSWTRPQGNTTARCLGSATSAACPNTECLLRPPVSRGEDLLKVP